MFFKKKKIATQRKPTYLLALVGCIIVAFLGFGTLQATSSLDFQIFDFEGLSSDETTVSERKNTYILVTGRGGGNHDAPLLTDTIMLMGVNYKEEVISMLSIPRDLWVEYPGDSDTEGKINRIYETYAPLDGVEAMEKLSTKIEEITGKKIDHYINLDFNGFTQVVDTLGGVEVTLEKNFVDYQYPDGKLGYKTFVLRKGTWTLDGEVALMYARSRHSTSDFDRSLRQQEILSSLKKKISELGYFKDRRKIRELYTALRENIETDMSITQIIDLALAIRAMENTTTLSHNLNDTCFQGSDICSKGGFLYVPQREFFYGASVLLPKGAYAGNLNEYGEIQNYARMIFENPDFFIEAREVNIYNNARIPGLASDFANMLIPYGFQIDKVKNLHNLSKKEFENSTLLYNSSIPTNDETLLWLREIGGIQDMRGSISSITDESRDIELVLTGDLEISK